MYVGRHSANSQNAVGGGNRGATALPATAEYQQHRRPVMLSCCTPLPCKQARQARQACHTRYARMLFPRLQRAASLPLTLRGEQTLLSRLAQKLQGTYKYGFWVWVKHLGEVLDRAAGEKMSATLAPRPNSG